MNLKDKWKKALRDPAYLTLIAIIIVTCIIVFTYN